MQQDVYIRSWDISQQMPGGSLPSGVTQKNGLHDLHGINGGRVQSMQGDATMDKRHRLISSNARLELGFGVSEQVIDDRLC